LPSHLGAISRFRYAIARQRVRRVEIDGRSAAGDEAEKRYLSALLSELARMGSNAVADNRDFVFERFAEDVFARGSVVWKVFSRFKVRVIKLGSLRVLRHRRGSLPEWHASHLESRSP
jgi:hypothetical protein